MAGAERLIDNHIFAFYAHGKTRTDAKKLVKILAKQNPRMKYRIIKQKYRYGTHYAVYIR